MTLLMMDWNSSSVYSRVGKGAILIFEGLNCVQGILRDDITPVECNGVSSIFSLAMPVSDCWAANMIKESNTC